MFHKWHNYVKHDWLWLIFGVWLVDICSCKISGQWMIMTILVWASHSCSVDIKWWNLSIEFEISFCDVFGIGTYRDVCIHCRYWFRGQLVILLQMGNSLGARNVYLYTSVDCWVRTTCSIYIVFFFSGLPLGSPKQTVDY